MHVNIAIQVEANADWRGDERLEMDDGHVTA